MHHINLLYNKTIVDLCFSRHGVLLNSKLNHIDLRSTSVNVTFTVQLHTMSTSTQVNNCILCNKLALEVSKGGLNSTLGRPSKPSKTANLRDE